VTATLEGDDGSRYEGAAVLRSRPHPRTGEPVPQLGVPDDALGFRPRPGARFRLRIEPADGEAEEFTSPGAWLERVQSSWWFVLERD
jgi:hypothetical protein